jgi:hypothetical protein
LELLLPVKALEADWYVYVAIDWADGRNHMLGLLKGPLDSFPSLIPDLTDPIHHLERQGTSPKRRGQSTSLLW